MLCPICNKQLAVHNTTMVNEKLKLTYSCVTDKILVDEKGEIILTDFLASPNITNIKERLSQGFDFADKKQLEEFTLLVITLVKYAERLEQQLKEKTTILNLLRSAELSIKNSTDILGVNDE